MSRPTVLRQILVAALFLAIVALIALVGSAASAAHVDGWYANAEKVSWNPPNWLFGPAWGTLYILIALSGWLVWRNAASEKQRHSSSRVLTIFGLQLLFNAIWTPLFFAGYPMFGAVAWWAALIVMLLLIISVSWYAKAAAPVSSAAAWLMLPYLLWLLYAASLNIGIIVLNS